MNLNFLILTINILIFIFLLIFSIFLLRKMRILKVLRRSKIDVNNPHLVDGVIHNEQAIPISIGEKTLYMQMMTFDVHDLYFAKFNQFLKLHKDRLNNLKFFTYDKEKSIEELLLNLPKNVKSFFRDKTIQKQQMEIIKSTFLADKNINKDKISYRYFKKHLKLSQLIELFFIGENLVLDSVESFIHCLLKKRLEGRQEGDRRRHTYGLWSGMVGHSIKQEKHQPRKPFYFGRENPNDSSVKTTKVMGVGQPAPMVKRVDTN